MGVMSSSVHSPGDHVEESLPLQLLTPPACPVAPNPGLIDGFLSGDLNSRQSKRSRLVIWCNILDMNVNKIN